MIKQKFENMKHKAICRYLEVHLSKHIRYEMSLDWENNQIEIKW